METEDINDRLRTLKIPEYRKAVDALFSLEADCLIPNSSIYHAAVISEMMIKHTPQGGNIYFLCKNLNKQCFETAAVLEAVREAVRRNVTFHIAYTDPNPESGALKEILNQVEFNYVRPLLLNNKEVNFSTNGKAIRLEMDASEPHADVVPNAPEISARMVTLYNSLSKVQ